MFTSRIVRAVASTSSAGASAASSSFYSPVVHLPLTRWPSTLSTATTATTSSDDTSAHLVPLPSYLFASPSRPDILHQCVVTHLASLRQGSAHTKNRAEVRGSNRKIMRQKGLGKARAGDAKSPIRRGGGRAFPKRQRDFSLGLNHKVWQLGVRTALSERWRRGELSVIPEAPSFDAISAHNLVQSLSDFPLQDSSFPSLGEKSSKVLFLVSDLDTNFALSARNLPNVRVELVDDIEVYDLLQGHRIVLDLEAVQYLEDWLGSRHDIGIGEEEGGDEVVDFGAASMASAGQEPGVSPDGGEKKNDVVIDQEEAPVWEKREQADPLAGKQIKDGNTGNQGQQQQQDGDAIREEMEELGKQEKDTVQDADRPNAKDLL